MKTTNKLFLIGLVLLLSTGCKKAIEPLAVPYEPSMTGNGLNPVLSNTVGAQVQEFNEKISGNTESNNRLQVGNPWSDFEPTGFYMLPNKGISLNVEQLNGTSLPKLLIGSYSRDSLRWDPLSIQLKAGINNIPADTLGGMLWIRFITSGTPSSKVRITFNDSTTRVPVYIKDQTSDWQAQLSAYANAPDVLLINDHVYLQYDRTRAVNTTGDVNFLLQTIDKGVTLGEDYISGFDDSAPEHMKPTHKILMTQSNKTAWGAATWYRTSFAPGLISGALTPQTIVSSGWGAWHELGHMRQQQAWKWSTLGEVTVNIYTLAAERAINGGGINRLKGTTTTNALNFIANTDTAKNFNGAIPGNEFTRLFMFHQLWLAFGDEFYINLHKQTRVEKPSLSTDADKMRYFMLKACTISGRDLTTFFQKWGFKVSAAVYTEIANLKLPQPLTEPSTLTDDNVSSSPANNI